MARVMARVLGGSNAKVPYFTRMVNSSSKGPHHIARLCQFSRKRGGTVGCNSVYYVYTSQSHACKLPAHVCCRSHIS